MSNGHTLASKEGERQHSLSSNEMPKHYHEWVGWAGTSSQQGEHSGLGAFKGGSWTVVNGGTVQYEGRAGIKNAGGGQAHNNMQPTIYLNYIIKY